MKNKSFILFLFLLAAQNAKSCDCAPMLDFEKYSFIALVSIDSVHIPIAFASPENPTYKHWSHNIEITVRTQFKGEKVNEVLVIGTNGYYDDVGNNCDMDIKEGDDWIIFGFGKGPIPTTGFCTPSIRYGHSKMHGQSAFRLYDDLYEYYLSYSCGSPDGYHIMHHPNGQLAHISCFENDLQEGEHVAYYTNGNLATQQFYIKGKMRFTALWFYKNGNVNEEWEFRDDGIVDNRKYYSVEGTLDSIVHYDENGYIKSTLIE